MKISKQLKMVYLQQAATPIQSFLKDFYDMHCAAIITQDAVKIVRDEVFVPAADVAPAAVVSTEDFEPKRKPTKQH